MTTVIGKLQSLNLGSSDTDLSKIPCESLQAELDGFVGDRHGSNQRQCWAGDKQPESTIRRNERQWSAMSMEELTRIEQAMDLKEPLSAAHLGVNLCFSGIKDFSLLAKGSLLKFPSGAELLVEEYNPPCIEMGHKIASLYTSNSGIPLVDTDFTKAAAFCRGLVGVVEVAGIINAGDAVTVIPYREPVWITRLSK
jgi:hypothetical protein